MLVDGGVLRAWRRALGWDVPEMARRLRQAAGDGHVPVHNALVRMIRRWERGSLRTERYELLYAAAFDVALGQLPIGPDGSGVGSAESARGGIFVLEEMAAGAVELGRLAEVTNVGSGTIGQLDAGLARIAREYPAAPPAPLVHRAAAIRGQIQVMLGGHQRLEQTRDLYLIGAKACAFLAWALSDLGHQRAAAAHGRTALILADEAGHPGARALALAAQSKIAFFDGALRLAAELARRGFECCPPNSTRVLLACQEADAAAVPAAVSAIERADGADEEISIEDDLSGPFSCGDVRRSAYAMSLGLRRGEPASVLAAETAAGTRQPGDGCSYGTLMQVHLTAALALLQSGEAEAAAGRLEPVLGLPPTRRLVTFGARLAQARAVLNGPRYQGSHPATELAGRIDSYFSEPGPAIVPYPVRLELKA
jgi:transcriptional regulator with XRE-family HTH domain